MFVALTPMTETVAGEVIHHPVGAPLHRWDSFSGSVKRALLNHGTVGEVADPPDIAPEPVEEAADDRAPADDDGDFRRVSSGPESGEQPADSEFVEQPDARELVVDNGGEVVSGGFVCDKCDGRQFTTRRSLSQHVRWAHPSEA